MPNPLISSSVSDTNCKINLNNNNNYIYIYLLFFCVFFKCNEPFVTGHFKTQILVLRSSDKIVIGLLTILIVGVFVSPSHFLVRFIKDAFLSLLISLLDVSVFQITEN